MHQKSARKESSPVTGATRAQEFGREPLKTTTTHTTCGAAAKVVSNVSNKGSRSISASLDITVSSVAEIGFLPQPERSEDSSDWSKERD
jgi:hypothetical protein